MARARAIAAPPVLAPRLDRLSSALLARRAAGGDERAFETIFRRYSQELYRYCLGIVRNPTDAEDALQATMAAALRALPGEERELALRPWLYRVAHNESISLIRGRRESALSVETDELVENSAAVHAEERERLRQLVGDLRALPDRQRSAILMRELSDLSYAEIAGALDCSEGAARQTVYEARSALNLIAEGRSMECEDARRAISGGDRRRLRGRRVRTHLHACEGCRDFEAAIALRTADLRMLFPALPAAAAATLMGGAVGGGGATLAATAGGTGVGAVGAAVGASAALKGASILAAAAVAVGAADMTGAIDLGTPLRGSGGAESSAGSNGGGPASESTATGRQGDSAVKGGHGAGGHAEGGAAGGPAGKTDGSGRPVDAPGAGASAPGAGQHGAAGQANAPGQTEGARNPSAPGQEGSSLGNAGEAPAGTGTAGGSGSAPADTGSSSGSAPATDSPGNSGSAPGQTGTAGNSGNAPGHTGTAGNSGSAPGQTGTAGNSGSAPGHTGTAPGNSGSAPGHTGAVPSVPGTVPGVGNPPSVPPGHSGVKPGKGNAQEVVN